VTEDLTAVLAGRAGWLLAGEVAQYAPTGGSWSARVRLVQPPGKTVLVWHTAVCAGGVARHTRFDYALDSAIRWAEGMVAAGNRGG
jgi:hypothetical protein